MEYLTHDQLEPVFTWLLDQAVGSAPEEAQDGVCVNVPEAEGNTTTFEICSYKDYKVIGEEYLEMGAGHVWFT